MLSVTCKCVFQYFVFSMGFDAHQVFDKMSDLFNKEMSQICLVFAFFFMLVQFLLLSCIPLVPRRVVNGREMMF